MHCQDLSNGYRNNMLNTRSVLKRILNKSKGGVSRSMTIHNNETITDDHLIANSFDNFFVNVGSELANRIPSSPLSPSRYMKTQIVNSVFLETVSPKELLQVIKCLKHSTVGYDELDAQHIKSSSSIISQPLLYIRNLSFTLVFSQMTWKLPKLSPCFNLGILWKLIISDQFQYFLYHPQFWKD